MHMDPKKKLALLSLLVALMALGGFFLLRKEPQTLPTVEKIFPDEGLPHDGEEHPDEEYAGEKAAAGLPSSASHSPSPSSPSPSAGGGESEEGETKKKGFFARLFSREKAEPETAPSTNAPEGSVPGPGVGVDVGAGVGAPDAPMIAAPGLDSAQPQEKKEPAEPIAGCFEKSFRHKKIASHADGEACIHHENVVTLNEPHINSRSLCVMVNGTPVHHKVVPDKKQTRVVFGPFAGPNSLVTVRYCLGKDTCGLSCKVPKDEFMDVIGGGELLDGETQIVKWDPKDKGQPDQAEVELQKELKSLKELLASNSGKDFFRDWQEKDQKPSCELKAKAGTQLSQNK